MITDCEGNAVVNEQGERIWEECMILRSDDTDALTNLNRLLAEDFYIYDRVGMGEAVFLVLRRLPE